MPINILDLKRSATGGLETLLTNAEGAKVKLTSNINVSDGLSTAQEEK